MSDLLEYSVVYSDRSLNHMSPVFQQVMRDISSTLKKAYNTDAAVIVPGSGTFAMEAIARQLAVGKKCLVIRNGWFSYRWSQIFEMGNIPSESLILTAQRVDDSKQPAFKPPALEEVVKTIKTEKPDLVFAPHVETSAGMILPDNYICTVSEVVHSVGGLFVLDCIASGTTWVDMEAVGVDILVSAPQKGWSASPCAGLVMLNARSRDQVMSTTSNSFACDLRKWLEIMEVYEQGKHAYHATMPTDSLKFLRDTMKEMCAFGFGNARLAQQQLGKQIRVLLESHGFKSVASEGFQADSVIVSYTDDKNIHTGKKFLDVGVQIAAGVPLKCGEPEDFQTFRIGLFGLDKLKNIETTVNNFKDALTKIKK
jgi:aspartate aminotransferase-like enzyme